LINEKTGIANLSFSFGVVLKTKIVYIIQKVIVFFIYEIASAFALQRSNEVSTSLHEQPNNFKSPIDICNNSVG